jgi:hypothetical protein
MRFAGMGGKDGKRVLNGKPWRQGTKGDHTVSQKREDYENWWSHRKFPMNCHKYAFWQKITIFRLRNANQIAFGDRVARFFLVKNTRTAKNIPNDHKLYLYCNKYTKWP